MAGKSSIWECLISYPQDGRVNWDYPTGSHLLMILHQCALTDAGKTWITDINVKSQEKVHLMMDPPRICIWGPPNNPIKYQNQLTLNQPGWSTRCAKCLLCAAANAVLIADGPCSQGENAGFTKDATFWDHPGMKKPIYIPGTLFLSEKVETYSLKKTVKNVAFHGHCVIISGTSGIG